MPKIVLRDKWFLERTYELHEPIIMRNGDSGRSYRLEFVQDGEQGQYQHVHAKVEKGSLNMGLVTELQEAMDVAAEYINKRAQFAPIVWRVKGLCSAFEQEEAESE